ncbi:MAG TPA: SEC-C metal-binding domain-containing protein [Pyrinomonadaceae bacterium]|nr:SEC-C metal-binding domain-containing protein [Pyrinomonadaceae bacterium]
MMSEIKDVLDKYPSLTFDEASKFFRGFVDIGAGDVYHVQINVRKFPKYFPSVYELHERIPRTNDRHCNLPDGSLCFTTEPKELILLRTKIHTLIDFFDEILVPYLQNNSYFEIHKEYRYGAFAHGRAASTYQTYQELLDIGDPATLIDVLKQLTSGFKFAANELCYCGSGRKLKKCSGHSELYRRIKYLSQEDLRKALLVIEEHLVASSSSTALSATTTTA